MTCSRTARMAPPPPTSRPSPAGGLRPALTPATGGAEQPRSGATATPFKIKNPYKSGLYGSRGLPVSGAPTTVGAGSDNGSRLGRLCPST